ncbi:unnamed protein product [Rotaria socialis]|uniref:Carbonyl reductase n=1 Tax=Rotaria socialis TaxID=392032 RepID=A0A818V1W8_9BILA|nr:unnamed protein product [Rotaria socialis]CAF4565053.1 unnamed protein product [Rotaria socialis]
MSTVAKLQRTILVTGGNKGIGFEVIKKLIKQPSSINDDLILLGSRDLKRGEDALSQLGSPTNVHLLQLDTLSKESISFATNEIKQKYGGQLDVIINNAGIAPTDESVEEARKTLATNYYGVKLLNDNLIPFLSDHGRVINVASGIGPMVLGYVSKDLQDKYTSATLTSEQLDCLVEDFVLALESNNLEKCGYTTELPYLAYGVSKMALIALTRIEAQQCSDARKIFVYSVCPGYCATDINKHGPGARSAELGADSILHVVNTSDHELKNGAFYRDGTELQQICMDEAKIQAFIQLMKHLSASK